MATERQLAANRRNAQKSTGPRSSEGKRRASQNSRRHGFTAVSFRAGDPKQVELLARQIAGKTTNPVVLEKARGIAQATFDLAQIRRAKVDLIASRTAQSEEAPSLRGIGHPSDLDALDRGLHKLDRYEKRTIARRSQGMRAIIDFTFVCAKRTQNSIRITALRLAGDAVAEVAKPRRATPLDASSDASCMRCASLSSLRALYLIHIAEPDIRGRKRLYLATPKPPARPGTISLFGARPSSRSIGSGCVLSHSSRALTIGLIRTFSHHTGSSPQR